MAKGKEKGRTEETEKNPKRGGKGERSEDSKEHRKKKRINKKERNGRKWLVSIPRPWCANITQHFQTDPRHL